MIKQITIVADDTDFYILLIRIACYCRSILYFYQGTSLSKAGITYHVSSAASEFGESICKILPSFHAFIQVLLRHFIVVQKYKASKKC